MSLVRMSLFVALLIIVANVNDGALITARRNRHTLASINEVHRVTIVGYGESYEQTPHCRCVCGVPDDWDWSGDDGDDGIPTITPSTSTEPGGDDVDIPTITPSTSTEHEVTTPTTTTTTAAPLCPLDTHSEMIRVRHETDCSSYYECTDGHRVLRRCRPGDRFNVDLEVCDLAENVDCTNRAHYP